MSKAELVSADRISEGDSMIRVENLTKKFGDFVALDDISFDVRKGEVFGLLGPNGAGKSTTLRILSTLARPTGGTATIGGHDIVKDDTEVRKLIGIVSEKMIMYDRLTARENLWFFGSLFDIPSDVLTTENRRAARIGPADQVEERSGGDVFDGDAPEDERGAGPAEHAPACCSWTSPR